MDTFIWTVIGIIASWLITHKYYLKSLKDQREEFLNTEKDYRRIIEKFTETNQSEINRKILREKRLEQCIEKYTQTGGGDHLVRLINTYEDLSNEEKAEMLDVALVRARGRKAKNNPFKSS